jgi:hypothetical protein
MTASYQHLAVGDVKPGMILSDELSDSQGHVLLPQGAVLTKAILAAMAHHGIDTLPVLCAEVSQAEEAAQLDVRQERLTRLFRKHDPDSESDWATALLRRYVAQFRLGTQAEQ